MKRVLRSLSFRLLILTIFFVMLAEVLIYSPSVARFREAYLVKRLGAAHLAALTIAATPDGKVAPDLSTQALSYVGAYQLAITQDGEMQQELRRDMVPPAAAVYDLRTDSFMSLVFDAFVTLAQTENRVIDVIGHSPQMPSVVSMIRTDEMPLRTAMLDFSWRILSLSILISIFTAALVFISLQWLLVAPVQRLTTSMVAFRQSPDDPSHDLVDDGRRDEIGVAIRELGLMKTDLRHALHQQTRLAALGKAVAKVNHDLRNILTSATLISDSLSDSNDPRVQKMAPVLIRAIDRAVRLCTETLNFVSDTPVLSRRRFAVSTLIKDLAAAAQVTLVPPMAILTAGDAAARVDADYDQLYRVFENLTNNAHKAGAKELMIRIAPGNQGCVEILFQDNGRGVSEAARATLFEPFSFTSSTEGFGLGLAVCADIIRAHGGEMSLQEGYGWGSVFQIYLPAAGVIRQS